MVGSILCLNSQNELCIILFKSQINMHYCIHIVKISTYNDALNGYVEFDMRSILAWVAIFMKLKGICFLEWSDINIKGASRALFLRLLRRYLGQDKIISNTTQSQQKPAEDGHKQCFPLCMQATGCCFRFYRMLASVKTNR